MPFAAMAARLAASRLGLAASFERRAGGDVTALRVVLSRPEDLAAAGIGPGARIPAAIATLPASALAGRPERGDLLTVAATRYVIEDVEADARGASWRLALRRA